MDRKVTAIPGTATGSNSVLFGDDPVKRDVSDVLANSVLANYSSGSLQVVPSLHITRTGADHLLSWPSWAANFTLEAADVLGAGAVWAPPPALGTNIAAGEIQITAPSSSAQRFFRLRLP